MSKKNCARRPVALIAIVLLSLAPVTLAADATSPVSFLDSVIELVTDSLNELFGDRGERSGNADDGNEDDGGTPDFDTTIDPVG